MFETVSTVDVQRREGSLYPDLVPKGNFVENVRFKLILRGWVGFGNIGEEIWYGISGREKSLSKHMAFGEQEKEWFHVEEWVAGGKRKLGLANKVTTY